MQQCLLVFGGEVCRCMLFVSFFVFYLSFCYCLFDSATLEKKRKKSVAASAAWSGGRRGFNVEALPLLRHTHTHKHRARLVNMHIHIMNTHTCTLTDKLLPPLAAAVAAAAE